MKISVIVPIYNVEQYLSRCIQSILAQTYTNLEIILVDDGSPDQCPAICDKYAKIDNRIIVIHKSNGGLSDARNAGLQVATGDWLSFVDSDDWIEPYMYDHLINNALQYGAQMSVGGVSDEMERDGNSVILKTTYTGREEIMCIPPIDAMRKHLNGSWAAWDKIYHREIFNGIRFPVGEINEDEPIMLLLLERCQKIVYTNKVLYHYMHRGSSITSSSFTEKKLVWVKHCKDNLAWIEKNYPELISAALHRYACSLLWSTREILLAGGDLGKHLPALRHEIASNGNAFLRCGLSWKEKLRLIAYQYLPFFACRILESRFRTSIN